MTDRVVPPEIQELAGLIGPETDEIIEVMEDHADTEGFPTVGPEVGTWLSVLAQTTDAQRIFEFGSGFGYSAYWFARGMNEGEIILTEIDADELSQAREYFQRAGIADRAHFEHGDAIDILEEYDGAFDIVLIDNEKQRYREALEAVEAKLQPGSLVLADNAITAGVINRDEVIALLDGETIETTTDASWGIAEYLDYVRGHDRLETALLPAGEGVAVSVVTDS
jgi:predicted O-methyltransferase YrrM